MSKAKIDQCYLIEDNNAALDCLKTLVQEPAACQPRLVLFTQGNCLPCKSEASRYEKDIADGTIQEIDVDSPEGSAIAIKNGIDIIPALVVLDCHDNIIEPGV